MVVLGDSFTFGLGVDDDSTYCAQLEELVPDLEVLNMGVNGYGTDQQLLHWNMNGRRFSPDLVLIGIYVPDFHRNGLSVRDNLLLAHLAKSGRARVFWRRVSREHAARAAIERVAAQVGLDEVLDRPVNALSYGAVRQLEIGLALATDPKVLLLDEPTSGMSPEETGRMLALVSGLPRNLAVVIIEHDMDMVFEAADRITVLNYGEVLLEGTPEEVRGSAEVQETYLGG